MGLRSLPRPPSPDGTEDARPQAPDGMHAGEDGAPARGAQAATPRVLIIVMRPGRGAAQAGVSNVLPLRRGKHGN